jgi:hypothetical protein
MSLIELSQSEHHANTLKRLELSLLERASFQSQSRETTKNTFTFGTFCLKRLSCVSEHASQALWVSQSASIEIMKFEWENILF